VISCTASASPASRRAIRAVLPLGSVLRGRSTGAVAVPPAAGRRAARWRIRGRPWWWMQHAISRREACKRTVNWMDLANARGELDRRRHEHRFLPSARSTPRRRRQSRVGGGRPGHSPALASFAAPASAKAGIAAFLKSSCSASREKIYTVRLQISPSA
jgi:hypothetical protein